MKKSDEMDLNNVEGHKNYDYSFLIERIETMMKQNEELDTESTNFKAELP